MRSVHICSSIYLIVSLQDEAVDQGDESPDFYINICQPLNPIPGVTCPPGAAVCKDPDDGPPVVRHWLTQPDADLPSHYFLILGR